MRPKQIFFPEPGYVPKVYGYGRVSHKGQEDSTSIEAQEERIRGYFELRKKVDPNQFKDAVWVGMYAEPKAFSAYSNRFENRPAGSRLLEILQPSDHIIVDALDRVWRDLRDYVLQSHYFMERGISLHFVNFLGGSVDTSSPMGQLMLDMSAVFSEFESLTKSYRVSNARSHLRAQGLHDGSSSGSKLLFEIVGGDPNKKRGGGGKLMFRPGALKMLKEIVAARDSGQAGLLKQSRKLKLHKQTIKKLYVWYKAWEHAGFPDVNTIKHGEMVKNYKHWKEQQGGSN